ncbi:hypothetical protein PIB30_048971 [Stylosanthes scabra]|uniref:Uncharacterized protein n=1 Tax=Stylosanthes scabra TaxID=79078 RepID=A0ABU6UKK3_9FABA|nr:hypothetical protein [Stylosanthes scabra]
MLGFRVIACGCMKGFTVKGGIKVAAVEAACSEKVRSLESTVQTQSQEVSDLRKAYADMYAYLSQIRSGSSASGMPEMPPPPPPPPPPLPPPARSQDPPPQPEQFLDVDHQFRRNKESFRKNRTEHDDPPNRLSGIEVWQRVSGIPRIVENGAVMDDDRTKDNDNARLDLEELCKRPELNLRKLDSGLHVRKRQRIFTVLLRGRGRGRGRSAPSSEPAAIASPSMSTPSVSQVAPTIPPPPAPSTQPPPTGSPQVAPSSHESQPDPPT